MKQLQKRINLCAFSSAWLMWLTTIFSVSLIIIVLYYQFGVLMPNNYHALAPNAGNNVVNYYFGYQYINHYGLKAFFGASLGAATYWPLVASFFSLTLITLLLNSLFGSYLLYLGWKNKNSQLLKLGCWSLFGYLLGAFCNWKYYQKHKLAKLDRQNTRVSKLQSLEAAINQKLQN